MGRSRSPRVDPIRVPGSRGTNSITSELESIRSQGPETGPFSRGVVFEVLGDLSQRSDEEVEALAASLTSGVQALRRAPRNSLIVQLTAGSSSTSIGTRHLCHPFFPPHLSMPIKPGEQVWVLFENPGSNNRYGYWICRVTEMDPVDDVNFTHPDRRFDLYVDKVQTETLSSVVGDDNGEETRPFDGLKDPNKVPGPPHFANGPIDDDNADPTLPILEEGDPSPYDQIYTGSISMQSVTLEPVPRFTKRPGDLVLQGSNNALICLGQDRGWTRDERPDSVEHSNAYVTLSGDG
ncbi:MAG: hypothetical protein NWE76_09975, partial [Candidatus Bathyarchaeota archaeon]|nr:hypothetical protein [Candidatus Bathyarchaeota archaeon]